MRTGNYNKKPNYSLKLIIAIVIMTNSLLGVALENQLSNGDSLSLFGIGIHQEKRNDIYVGAMFASSGITTKKQLFEVSTNKRMSIKFLTSYSNRKMARLLKQRISMNNTKENWKPFTQSIIKLSKIFRRSLQSGDEINVDYTAEKGTTVYLNKTLFFEEPNPNFYNILLNIWFGSIPPTEAFKVGISGKNTAYLNDQLIGTYNSLSPQIGRFDADKISLARTQPQKKVSTKKTQLAPKKTAKKNTPKDLTQDKPINESEQKKVATGDELDIEAPKIKLESLLAAPVVTEKTALAADAIAQAATNETDKNKGIDSDQENDIDDPEVTLKTQPENTKPIENTAILDIEGKQSDDDFDLISGSYTQELIATIRAKQSYPKKALRDGIQGSLILQLVIDKDGDIERHKLLKRSGSKTLDRGVIRMIKRAEPYPKIPEELGLEEFEIEIPLSFTLSD